MRQPHFICLFRSKSKSCCASECVQVNIEHINSNLSPQLLNDTKKEDRRKRDVLQLMQTYVDKTYAIMHRVRRERSAATWLCACGLFWAGFEHDCVWSHTRTIRFDAIFYPLSHASHFPFCSFSLVWLRSMRARTHTHTLATGRRARFRWHKSHLRKDKRHWDGHH